MRIVQRFAWLLLCVVVRVTSMCSLHNRVGTHPLPCMHRSRARDIRAADQSDMRDMLRQAFYAPSANEEQLAPRDEPAKHFRKAGILRDMPLCRWPVEILPTHQKKLIVHEPQDILLFEQLLATPQPNEYVHMLLHDGAESLGNPEMALQPGSKSALAGTLTRIVAHASENVQTTDSGSVRGLVLVVQGLSRVQTLNEVQAAPYSRADVLIAPDVEELRASARLSRRWLRQTDHLEHTDAPWRVRLALACAMASQGYWRPLELHTTTTSLTPQLCGLNASHALGSGDSATSKALLAVEDLAAEMTAAANSGMADTAELGMADAVEAGVAPEDLTLTRFLGAANIDAGYRNASAWHTRWLLELLDAIEDSSVEAEAELRRQLGSGIASSVGVEQVTLQAAGVDAAAAAEDERTLKELERQVCIATDCLECQLLIVPQANESEGGTQLE